MNRTKCLIAILLVVLSCAPAVAQVVAQGGQPDAAGQPAGQEVSPAHAGVSLLTAYRFHLSAESIRTDDPRFDWDAYFGGDVDIVDYGRGRLNFLADYEVVIGSQYRRFDPNQGNYYLDLSASWRFPVGEFQGLFRHVSRHLSDRDNRQSVAWNDAGMKFSVTHTKGPMTIDGNLWGTKIVERAFVDYKAQAGFGGDVQYRVRPGIVAAARADLHVIMVDVSVAGRDTQYGGRFEGALRLYGAGAGVEAFLGYERRIDPYPVERSTHGWMVMGFRFLSR